MSTFTPLSARLGRVGLAFAALGLMIAAATPAPAQEDRFEKRYPFVNHPWECEQGQNCRSRAPEYRYRHRRHYDESYEPYYEPPRAYYPQPHYYQPGPSFNLTIPLGD